MKVVPLIKKSAEGCPKALPGPQTLSLNFRMSEVFGPSPERGFLVTSRFSFNLAPGGPTLFFAAQARL